MLDRNSLIGNVIGKFALLCGFLLASCTDQNYDLGTTSYQVDATTKRCEPGSRIGLTPFSNDGSTVDGTEYNVRTPLNYDPSIAHPLLVVYAPARANRWGTERVTKLTRMATAAGFIVAYADHPTLSTTTTVELGTIPELVSQKWCVDKERVFLTGHSDGGTVAMALALMVGTKHIPAAIAPSAAGISKNDLFDRSCPDPLPVMVMHSANDQLFPGYGAESAEWWAACNRCDLSAKKTKHSGCLAFAGCRKGADVLYCEGEHAHSRWPDMSRTVIEFFVNSGRF